MNKLYTTALALALCASGAMAQSTRTAAMHKAAPRLKNAPVTPFHAASAHASGDRSIIWTSDFSNPSDWVTGHYGAEDLDWHIGTGLVGTGTAAIDPIASPTASNGYAILDSDGHNNTDTIHERSNLTMAQSVDLTGYPAAVVEFYNQYRKWTDEECYMVVSLNNTDWPDLFPTTDISTMPNVYKVWPGMGVQEAFTNPTLRRINISAYAGGQPQVWVRFMWTGIFGYNWFIDDVTIATPPDNDMQLSRAWLVGDPNNYSDPTVRNLEYTRLPLAEAIPLTVKAAIFNNGGIAQSAVQVTATVNGTPYLADVINSLDAGQADTVVINTGWTPTAAGHVTVNFSIATSDPNDANPADNVKSRSYDVTGPAYTDGNSVMGQDTNSVDGYYPLCHACTQDGMATRFQIEGTGNQAFGVSAAFYTKTTPGALVTIHLDDDNGPLATIEDYEIDASDMSAAGEANFVNIPFLDPVDLDPTMDYELWVEHVDVDTIAIAVSGNVNPGGLLDHAPDATNNTIYTGTGNPAIMARLYLSPLTVGINEHSDNGLTLAANYPNPADQSTTIAFTLAKSSTVSYKVMDVNGKLVAEKSLGSLGNGQHTVQLDVSALASGVYTLAMNTNDARLSRCIVVAH